MDLTLSEPYRVLQAEIRAFIDQHGGKSPKVGGGRKRPDKKTLDWQKRLVEYGYAGWTIPREYGGFGAAPDVMEAGLSRVNSLGPMFMQA
jgi:alkylation response protein AidB-like acyl-CoA dehydrogenase